ncbi:hypothetical protein INT43_005494 [Umbelopsis isabellina]|uniref:Uncharacterized protein n=1 Tax=Mortierella isabellina TaxID=91625 RepID=A0A8H7PM43_MORIS|nr:hypothetical protein INT43_005494 [Umbelopsis isabellina]
MASNLNPSFSSSSLSTQTNLYEFLSELVYKRIATINYLRRTHEGTTHWFNTVLLSREDLTSMYPNNKMSGRTSKFFTLGVSLGPILDVTNQVDYVKALHLLLHEFECHNNDHQKPKMKNIFRKTRGKDDHSYVDDGEYTHLLTPNMPFELDYIQTCFTLFDLLGEAYHKLLVGTESLCTQAFCEQVLKCDAKLKKIVSMITKELDTLARNAIKEELKLIDPLSSLGKMSPIDIDWDNNNKMPPVDIS